MTTQDIRRIGPAQYTTLRILVQHDGCYEGKMALAAMVGPNGSTRFGGQTLDRCAWRGWLRFESSPDKRATLVVLTDAGRQVWDQLSGDAS